jgi:hypothetical protein
MPPKAMKGESSTLSSWMQPKPKHDDTQHSKSDDKTPTPTEVAESSHGSPTELVDSTAFDCETHFEQNGARTDGNDDGSDNDFDGLATDEAAAIAELMAQAAAKNVTIQVLVAVKRPREEPEPTEPTESEAELV